jgi:hypothetical protein
MVNRLVSLAAAAACLIIPVGTAPLALSDPPPDPAVQPAANDVAPPPDPAFAPSAPPGVFDTLDGWHMTVSAKDETELPVAPLTTAVSSREYLVGGTFTGSVKGPGKTTLTGGTLEAGYQIGCGIGFDLVNLLGNAGLGAGFNTTGFTGVNVPINGQVRVELKAGEVAIIPVDKKTFKGKDPRITITGLRVKIDGCAGQSFLRSYAIFTASTENTDDTVTYLGVTKVV